MQLYLLIALGIIGIFLGVWGTQTRGDWSRNIGIIGGLIWFFSIIWGFIQLGFKNGFVFIFATLIIGAVLSKILPRKI